MSPKFLRLECVDLAPLLTPGCASLGAEGVSCTCLKGSSPHSRAGFGGNHDSLALSLYINTVYMVHIQTAVEED